MRLTVMDAALCRISGGETGVPMLCAVQPATRGYAGFAPFGVHTIVVGEAIVALFTRQLPPPRARFAVLMTAGRLQRCGEGPSAIVAMVTGMNSLPGSATLGTQ
jgi:hypothetical protein